MNANMLLYSTMIKRGLLILLLFTFAASGLTAQTADDYRTDTPDPLIRKMPNSVTSLKYKGAGPYLEKVVEYIAENAVDEYDKVKKAHDWVALNIRYDTKSYFSGNYLPQDVNAVVKRGTAVCAGYSDVFKALCDALEVECEIVTGYARGYGRSLSKTENPHASNHAWNKVKIEGKWYLIDTTWDAGYVNGTSFTAEYETGYFFADPLQFLHNHFPYNPNDQLLSKPLTSEEFLKLPMVKPGFFASIEEVEPPLQKITEVNGQFFRIDYVPNGKWSFMHDLYVDGKQNNKIFSEKRRNGKISLTFNFQKSGFYRLDIFSSTKSTTVHHGIGEFGFDVKIPEHDIEKTIPGGARVLSPEQRELAKNTYPETTEFKIMPGKWKYIALIRGYDWRYLEPDEKGNYTISLSLGSTATWHLAASETECGVYQTLAVFTVK